MNIGYYRNIPNVIADVEKLRDGRIIKSISPVSQLCMETYPCKHSGGYLIIYTDLKINKKCNHR